jgi:hypothetical protein
VENFRKIKLTIGTAAPDLSTSSRSGEGLCLPTLVELSFGVGLDWPRYTLYHDLVAFG